MHLQGVESGFAYCMVASRAGDPRGTRAARSERECCGDRADPPGDPRRAARPGRASRKTSSRASSRSAARRCARRCGCSRPRASSCRRPTAALRPRLPSADELDRPVPAARGARGLAARRRPRGSPTDELALLRESVERFDAPRRRRRPRARQGEPASSTTRSIAAAGRARLGRDGALGDPPAARLQGLRLVHAGPAAASRRTTTSSSRSRSSVRDAERAALVMQEHVYEARDLLVANSAAKPRLRDRAGDRGQRLDEARRSGRSPACG